MLVEQITSEGLAHFSYPPGDGGRAAMVDPIHPGHLSAAVDRLDRDGTYTVVCGARATIGASVLHRAGFDRVDVYLGSSTGACKAAGHATVEPFADTVA